MGTTSVSKNEIERAKERRAAERRDRSAMDELIIRYARKSPEEIEFHTGIPARDAMERLGELLKARDWMTERQEEKLLIMEMGDLIDTTRDRMEHVSEQYYSDTANVALRGYEAIGKRMDARAAITDMEMAEITRTQAEVYIETLNKTVQKTIEYIAEVYPDMDPALEEAIIAGFQRTLPDAYEEVKARIRD